MLEKLEDKFEKLKLFDEDFGLSTTEILRNLSTPLGADYDGGEIKVIREGIEYVMYIYLPEKGFKVGCPSFFEIKLKIPCEHPFFGIRKSDSVDWVLEKVLSIQDYQVGDPDFDAKFYIKVKDKEWSDRLFSNNNIKQGISALLSHGFDSIRSENGELKVIKYISVGGPYPTVEMITNAILHIEPIIANFPTDYDCTASSVQGTANNQSIYRNVTKEANKQMAVRLFFTIVLFYALWHILHLIRTNF